MINKTYLNYDLPAGIVVFLVALPLCLGISLASGVPFLSGMIAGVIGGIVVGSFSNSHVSVSGPAAGLIAIVIASIASLGSFEAFLLAVTVSGIIQILMSVLKLGSIAEYFPTSVISGMLTAIGIIIIIKQLPHAFGYEKDMVFFSEEINLQNFNNIFISIFEIHFGATAICAISILIIMLWNLPLIKKFTGNIPGSLVAVIFSTIVSELLFNNFDLLAISAEHKVNVPAPDNFKEFLKLFTTPDFSQIFNPNIYVVALTIAVVGSIETLLCIEASDKLDTRKRKTSTSRELLAQGIGNSIAGLIGGLPITSVIVRTSANIQAKARTKVSTIIHGVLLLFTVILIPTLLNKIPLSCLAAILLIVGYKLCSPKIFSDFFKRSKSQSIPFIVTVIMILVTDLLIGVACGMAVSLFLVLKLNLKNSYFFYKENYEEGDRIIIHLAEEVSFLNKASIRRTLDSIPKNAEIIIDASRSFYIDDDVLDTIIEFKNIRAPLKRIKCDIKGFKDHYDIDNTHFVEIEKAK